MNKLQSIISIKPDEFINNHHLSFQQVKTINSIVSCQTSNLAVTDYSVSVGMRRLYIIPAITATARFAVTSKKKCGYKNSRNR